jgi:hypothetical protein
MNLFELEDSLPNGLHDAKLRCVAVDYVERIAILEIDLDLSDTETPTPIYRPARIVLRGFTYFAMGHPDPSYPFRDAGELTVDLSRPTKPFVPGCESESAFRLFISEFNSFIDGDTPEAELEWLGAAAPDWP